MQRLSYRINSLIMLMMLSALPVFSRTVSLNEAADIARSFFSSSSVHTPGRHVPRPESIVDVASTDAYYVFATRNAGKGFVIVSSDDELTPIVGYSFDGLYDPEKLPDGMKAYLEAYRQVATAMKSARTDYERKTRGGDAVEPLLKVKWNQMEPYNLLTPIRDGHSPTGCVATSIAQVMRYYNYPVAGKGMAGEFNYYYPEQSIQLGHAYDWANMREIYGYEGEYTEEEAIAVATLMRDIGYAINMDYGYNESGAQSCLTPLAMCRYFNYSTDMRFVERSACTIQYWTDLIRTDLKAGRPVIYAGSDGNSGHQFVCDGIDSDDLLHINWGWGGYGDGYFDMNILSPEYLGTGAGSGAYYREQVIVCNIHPADNGTDNSSWMAPVSFSNIYVSSYFSDEPGNNDPSLIPETFRVNYRMLNSTGKKIEYDTVMPALFIEDDNGNPAIDTPVYSYFYSSLKSCYYVNLSTGCDIKKMIAEGALKDGHYRIRLAPVAWDYDNPPKESLPYYSGDLSLIGFSVREGKPYLDDPSISKDNAPEVKVLDVSFSSGMKAYIGASTLLNVKLSNKSSRYEETVYDIKFIPEESYSDDVDFDELEWYGGLDTHIYPGAVVEETIELSRTPDVPGRYRLFLYNYDKGVVVREDHPMVVEFINLPEDEPVIMSQLRLYDKEFPRRNGRLFFDICFDYYNPLRTQFDIELWGRRKDVADAAEFLIARYDDSSINNGRGKVDDWAYSESNVLWYEELGQFETYIKIRDRKGGDLKLLAGEGNLAEFTLVESDEQYQAVLSSPMVINGGKPVEAVPGSYFDVDFEMITPTGLNIETDFVGIYIYASPRGDDWLNSFYLNSIKIDKPNLAPGETTGVNFRWYLRPYDEFSELIGKPLYIRVDYFKVDDEWCPLHPGSFEDSLCFTLVKHDDTSVSVIEPDSDAEYFNLQGIRTDKPEKGMYIRVTKGKSEKIVIK